MQASVDNTLLKARIAGRQIFWNRVSLRRATVSGEFWDAGDNVASPAKTMWDEAAKCLQNMVARDGVEPPTPAFSGL